MQNDRIQPVRAVNSTQVNTADKGRRVHAIGAPVMGIGLWGLSPVCEIGISRRSVYQMTASREQSLGEANCGGANVPRRQAIRHGKSRKGPWHMAKSIASGVGMTNDWLASQGVLSL